MSTAILSTTEPLLSEFRDEDGFRELLTEFVVSMAAIRREMRDHLGGGDFGQLRVQAHRLKGAGGGYGFPLVSAIAARLESACLHEPVNGGEIACRLDELDACLARLRV
jgi:HPt (histidine-containing phosphotransfer) domain-containing protein